MEGPDYTVGLSQVLDTNSSEKQKMFESGTMTHKGTNSAVANEDLEGLPQEKDQELESKASTALMSIPVVERESAESLK